MNRTSMAANTSNGTSNSTYEKMSLLPASDCIPWLVVSIAECLAIVILNIITIIVFVKQRQLQRRSTYLIIHLAIVDLLVGAVSGPLHIESNLGPFCDLWNYNWNITWSHHLKYTLLHLFIFTSLANLVFISLERLHATLFPLRHRVIKKRTYGVVIAAIWLITTSREIVQVVFVKTENLSMVVSTTLYFPYYLVFIFLICFSYILIFIKVRCSPRPQHHSAAGRRERKLTGTLFVVSLASFLPPIIYLCITIFNVRLILNLSLRSHFYFRMTMLILLLSNSLVNPIIYALRMPGFRAGVSQIFRRVQAL